VKAPDGEGLAPTAIEPDPQQAALELALVDIQRSECRLRTIIDVAETSPADPGRQGKK
jgi:hypothetical protein